MGRGWSSMKRLISWLDESPINAVLLVSMSFALSGILLIGAGFCSMLFRGAN